MDQWFRKAVAVAVMGCLMAASQAQLTNGSFESNFTGWNRIGDTLILDSGLGSGPTDGTLDAFLATATDGTVNPNVPIGSGVSAAQIETFLSLSSGTLSGLGHGTPILGSAISQTFTIGNGDSLAFDWDFMTNQVYNDGVTANSYAPDVENNDFAIVSLTQQGGGSSILILADTFFGYVNDPQAPGGFITGFTITPSTNPFVSETGFDTMTLSQMVGGTYQLGFAVFHSSSGVDNGINSALVVDAVHIDSVPEPATLAAVGVGVAALLRRRRRQ
jgi:hypothetical protein